MVGGGEPGTYTVRMLQPSPTDITFTLPGCIAKPDDATIGSAAIAAAVIPPAVAAAAIATAAILKRRMSNGSRMCHFPGYLVWRNLWTARLPDCLCCLLERQGETTETAEPGKCCSC